MHCGLNGSYVMDFFLYKRDQRPYAHCCYNWPTKLDVIGDLALNRAPYLMRRNGARDSTKPSAATKEDAWGYPILMY